MIDTGNARCLEIKDVSKKFGAVTAVDHLSLYVEQGQIFSLLGPSGCGKTTTLRLVAGLETVDQGEVLLNGKIVNDIPAHKRECSTVFQTLALFPHMTVEQNIAYGLERRKVAKKEIIRKVARMLDLVQLLGMEKRRPSQISGGQRQRVALARSLVLEPKILLLDEPLSSLDRKLRKEMTIELKRVQREVGITFLYVMHDQKVALSMSDRIAVMSKGKIEQIDTAQGIYEVPKTYFVAEFMGAVNIFRCRLASRSGEKMYFETEEGMKILAAMCTGVCAEKATGISVHPELIELSPIGTKIANKNVFKGKIAEMNYQGDCIEVKLAYHDSKNPITVSLSNRIRGQSLYKVGEEVLFHWEADGSNVLTD